IIYTTGYFHLSTERPPAAVIPESGDPALFIPGLESDQMELWWVKDCEAYFDSPGPVNRVRWIFERVGKRGLGGGRIGVEEPTPSRLAQMKLGAPQATIVNCRRSDRAHALGQGRGGDSDHASRHVLQRFLH